MGNVQTGQVASIDQCCGTRPAGAKRLDDTAEPGAEPGAAPAELYPADDPKALRPDEVQLLREVYAGSGGDRVELSVQMRKRQEVREIHGLRSVPVSSTKDHLSIAVAALSPGEDRVQWVDFLQYFDERKERQQLIQGRETPM